MYLYVLFTDSMTPDVIMTCCMYGWNGKWKRDFVTKPEEKGPIKIQVHKRMWDDNIKIDLKGTT